MAADPLAGVDDLLARPLAEREARVAVGTGRVEPGAAVQRQLHDVQSREHGPPCLDEAPLHLRVPSRPLRPAAGEIGGVGPLVAGPGLRLALARRQIDLVGRRALGKPRSRFLASSARTTAPLPTTSSARTGPAIIRIDCSLMALSSRRFPTGSRRHAVGLEVRSMRSRRPVRGRTWPGSSMSSDCTHRTRCISPPAAAAPGSRAASRPAAASQSIGDAAAAFLSPRHSWISPGTRSSGVGRISLPPM